MTTRDLLIRSPFALAPGAVVWYHPPAGHSNAKYVVTARVGRNRYALADHAYPEQTVPDAHRLHLTPTKEAVDLCSCRHDLRLAGRRGLPADRCSVYNCRCSNHVKVTR